MDQLKPITDPLIQLLPEGLRDYGLAILAGVALLILLIVVLLLRSLIGRRKPKPMEGDREFQEDLAGYPPAPAGTGQRGLTVYNVPVRLRLVVVAPAGKDAQVDATRAERLLDQIVPGLTALAARDRPRIRVWPPQLSHHGFASTFFRRTLTPEREGQASPWILVAGRAQIGKQAVNLGLALRADEANMLGRKELEPHQWIDVLRLQ